jgi:hypothetical protein
MVYVVGPGIPSYSVMSVVHPLCKLALRFSWAWRCCELHLLCNKTQASPCCPRCNGNTLINRSYRRLQVERNWSKNFLSVTNQIVRGNSTSGRRPLRLLFAGKPRILQWARKVASCAAGFRGLGLNNLWRYLQIWKASEEPRRVACARSTTPKRFESSKTVSKSEGRGPGMHPDFLS